MIFKIGDKIQIIDGSFSIELQNNEYNKKGVRGNANIVGTVLAVDCRLPFVPTFPGTDSDCPTDGVTLGGCNRTLFNDLLVQTDGGFIFTSSKCVKLVKPKEYKLVLCSVEVPITIEQKDQLENAMSKSGLIASVSIEEK